MGRRLRKMLNVTLVLVTSAVLLEIVLQGLSFVVWLATPSPVARPERGGREVVLCVGDSFTHGIGSSREEGNYPAQLQARLRSLAPDVPWHVVNCGWSGQDSAQVLWRLDRQLAEHHPRFVCVIVGINDRWSVPGVLKLPPQPQLAREGFRLELRTVRLAKLLAQLVRTVFAGKPKPKDTGPAEVAKPEPAEDPRKRGNTALYEGRLEDALACFEKVIEREPDDGILRASMVDCYMRVGRKAEAEEQARWLERRYREEPSVARAEAFAGALLHVNRSKEALDFALSVEGRYPESGELQALIGRLQAMIGDVSAAIVPLDRSIELTPRGATQLLSWRHWERSRILSGRDPALAMNDIVTSHLLDPTLPDRTKGIFRLWEGAQMLALFERTLDELNPPAPMRQELARLYEEAHRPPAPEAQRHQGPQGTWSLDGMLLVLASDHVTVGGITLPVAFEGGTARGTLDGRAFELTWEPEGDRLVLSVASAGVRRSLSRSAGPAQPPEAAVATGAAPDDPKVTGPLEAHLRQIVERARAAGAEVVIGAYPCDASMENRLLRKVAAETGCGSADVRAAFVELLKTRDRRELFASDDSHCTDAGYGILAAVVADEILRLAKKTR